MSLILNRGASLSAGGQIVAEVEESLTSRHPDLHTLLAYYQARRRADGLLARAVLEPRDLLPILPHLFIAEPTGDGEWRFRLIGTGLVDRFGRDFTAKSLGAVYQQPTAARFRELFQRIARERRSVVTRNRFLVPSLDHARGEALQLPLLAVDSLRVMVFGGMFFR